MEYIGGFAGGVLGFIAGDIPGAISGAEMGYKVSAGGINPYEVVKTMTGGGTGVRELSEGIIKKGLYGSGVAPLVGSNKRVTGSAKKLPENKSMPPYATPPRTPKKSKSKKRKAVSDKPKNATKKHSRKRTKAAKKMAKYKPKGVSEGRTAGYLGEKQDSISLNKCHKLGYVTQAEKYGSVADANCVYIMHTTFDVNGIARSIIASLYRKLFKLGGIEISNEMDELRFNGFDSSSVRIHYVDQNIANGTLNNYVFDIADNMTFLSLIDQTCVYTAGTIFQKFVDTMLNTTAGDGNDGKLPVTLMFQVKDLGDGEFFVWRNRAVLNLQNERIVFMAKSILTVQNRTKGSNASANDYDDQRVDNQPLKGKLYEFSNADPRLKQTQTISTDVANGYDFTISSAPAQGVRTFGGTLTGVNALMREPPPAKIWKNVKKTSPVLLQPGDIKRSVLTVSYDKPLPELLNKFRAHSFGAPVTLGTAMFTEMKAHKSEILALEEVLRTPADNPINCTYEVEITTGAYCYSKKSKSYLRTQQFEEQVFQWGVPV